MVEAAQRTPVSMLLDLCNQKELSVDYELISVVGQSHDPTFKYRVKVKDIVAEGSGQSKKKAKHLAAKLALEQLLSKDGSYPDGFVFYDVKVTAETLNTIIVEQPVSEPINWERPADNAVGMLQEYCSKHKEEGFELSAPYYETVDESGPPHDRVFCLECTLSRGERRFTTSGKGKTKKIAKKHAADEMLKLVLKDAELNPVIPCDTESSSQETGGKGNSAEDMPGMSEGPLIDLSPQID